MHDPDTPHNAKRGTILTNISNKEYARLVERRSPRSPIFKNTACAFVAGGLICAGGQGLLALYGSLGLSEEEAGAAASVTLIFLGALLTGLGVYDKLSRFAGAGTLVPVTGFANAIVSPAMEFRSEGLVLGTGARLFTVAGPVIVFGVAASVCYGIVLAILR
ncbi:MAG: stage V sporulation protein AC [Oscillospiraceae bacterium]|jgi:stage V sporulation protein AC|nr:stage V sporulation protein AC [Oscillospiraceae bacterium]